VIGHGIGGSNAIGEVLPHTNLASDMHSLNRASFEHALSLVSQVIVLAVPGVVQNLMWVQPAFSNVFSSSVGSGAMMWAGSEIRTTAPFWSVSMLTSFASGLPAQAPMLSARATPDTICQHRNTDLL
jgi:hypothetical protein